MIDFQMKNTEGWAKEITFRTSIFILRFRITHVTMT